MGRAMSTEMAKLPASQVSSRIDRLEPRGARDLNSRTPVGDLKNRSRDLFFRSLRPGFGANCLLVAKFKKLA